MICIRIGGNEASADPEHSMKQADKANDRKAQIDRRHTLHTQERADQSGVYKARQIL